MYEIIILKLDNMIKEVREMIKILIDSINITSEYHHDKCIQ